MIIRWKEAINKDGQTVIVDREVSDVIRVESHKNYVYYWCSQDVKWCFSLPLYRCSYVRIFDNETSSNSNLKKSKDV